VINLRIDEKQGDAVQASLDFQSALQLSPEYRLARCTLERIDQHR
jgi:hypothetical protein